MTDDKQPAISWEDCKAGRKQQSELLTQLIMNRYSYQKDKEHAVNTFSLNIDATWGYGKTFFIERWAKDLSKQGHICLMFNAWQHDYSKDALTCLLSSLYSQMETIFKEAAPASKIIKRNLGAVGEKMKKVALKTGPAAVSALTLATIGIPIGGIFARSNPDASNADEATERIISEFGAEVGNELFKNREGYDTALKEFRKSMKNLTDSIDNNGKLKLPIFIFIDDLDRCRPDFTLEIIECVKHILEIDNLYFVFSTDTEQLQHSLKAVYGEAFESERYLKRIFNRECKLTEPNHQQFSEFIFSAEGGFNSKNLNFSKILLPIDPQQQTDNNVLANWFGLLTKAYDLDLRTQISCKLQIEDLLNIRNNQYTMALILMHLVVLWNKDKKLAEDQSRSNVLIKPELISDSVEIDTLSMQRTRGAFSNKLKLKDVLNIYYDLVGNQKSELNDKLENPPTYTHRSIIGHGFRFTNDTRSNTPDYPIEYESLFKQIKMISS